MNIKILVAALLLVGLFIALLTGIPYALMGSTPAVNMVVGSTYFLGVYSLYLMYQSRNYNKEKRLYMLMFGCMGVIVAFFSLEILLKLGIR